MDLLRHAAEAAGTLIADPVARATTEVIMETIQTPYIPYFIRVPIERTIEKAGEKLHNYVKKQIANQIVKKTKSE